VAVDPTIREQIDRVCRGWTGLLHWSFAGQLFTRVPSIHDVCILGVYMGRDTAYMATHLQALRTEPFHITAVDLFSDEPCADWEPEKIGKTWEEAGFGGAPNIEGVRQNLESLGLAQHVTLVKQDGATFLRETDQTFDYIFIDTSHDYETTRDTIIAAWPRLRKTGIMAGDDFSDEGTWGVKRAVRELCPQARVYGEWIWFAAKPEFTGLPEGEA
jgi:hypothetical protein